MRMKATPAQAGARQKPSKEETVKQGLSLSRRVLMSVFRERGNEGSGCFGLLVVALVGCLLLVKFLLRSAWRGEEEEVGT